MTKLSPLNLRQHLLSQRPNLLELHEEALVCVGSGVTTFGALACPHHCALSWLFLKVM